MGSAKTAMLLTQAYNFEERQMEYLCFKPVIDTREQRNVIRSRIGIERECRWIYPDTDLYSELRHIFEQTLSLPSWLLVDEAQFLSAAQVEQLARVTDDFGCNVMCYGLRTDFKGELFEGSYALLVMADKIEEVKTICWCGKKATFNARFDEQGKVLKEGEQVVLGANDKYIGLCRRHWMEGNLGPDFGVKPV